MDKDESKRNAFFDCVEPDEENISESFICCVCLDLLYKPIVLACGHASCFWCVHQSMNGFGESNCPVCRHSYHHFPTICQMLHFLIIKMYPNAYQRRNNQMLEEEQKTGCFSPQFEASSLKSDSLGGSAFSSIPCSESKSSSEFSELEMSECLKDDSMAVSLENNRSQTISNGTLNQISITDVLCPICRKLLFRPAVLNCGHAYCESCIAIPEDGIIICRTCESSHPSDVPKVCLELKISWKKHSPNNAQTEKIPLNVNEPNSNRRVHASSSSKKSDSRGADSPTFPSGDLLRWLTEHGPKVHVGVGCDYCGIFPIVGNRYRCKDCKEAMGFDLCGECYNTQSKLPGRFNQQHTAEHKFELIKNSDTAQTLMLRFVTGNFDHGPMVLSTDVSEDEDEDGPVMLEFSNISQENTDNIHDEDSAESNDSSRGDQNNNIPFQP